MFIATAGLLINRKQRVLCDTATVAMTILMNDVTESTVWCVRWRRTTAKKTTAAKIDNREWLLVASSPGHDNCMPDNRTHFTERLSWQQSHRDETINAACHRRENHHGGKNTLIACD